MQINFYNVISGAVRRHPKMDNATDAEIKKMDARSLSMPRKSWKKKITAKIKDVIHSGER